MTNTQTDAITQTILTVSAVTLLSLGFYWGGGILAGLVLIRIFL